MAGSISFREMSEGTFSIGDATVEVFPVVHVGPTNGYRITAHGGSVVYISDYQQPSDGSLTPSPEVVERVRGADLLIHDAQYDPDEFRTRSDWGHCTVDFAVEVARQAEVGRLALYHHDPSHDDAWVDRATEAARERAQGRFEVVAAKEGDTLVVVDR
jgi:ribonuclease BN (tRNA processing enzyme)